MRDSFVFYSGWYMAISNLPEEERVKAYDAIMQYALFEEEPEPGTIAAAIFMMAKPLIDKNRKRYENGCRGADYGKRGGRPKKENPDQENKNPKETPNKPQENPKETPNRENKTRNDNVNDNENVNVKEKPSKEGKKKTDPVSDSDMSEPMKDKVREWLRYKNERREPYKPTGLQTLVNRIAKEERAHGTGAVMRLIDDSMSNGWRGIIWDRLGKQTYGARDTPRQLTGFDALIAMEEAANDQG